VTEVLLLLLGCALIMSGAERLMSVQLLPVIQSQVWDTSRLLDDSSIIGSMVSAFTGYRARPPLMGLLVFTGYWALITLMMRPPRRQQVTA
jgi:high-affinity iron transporter